MSKHREDWKRFDVMSGELSVMDVADKSGGNKFTLNHVKGGEWAAFAEFDDDNAIRHVVAGTVEVLDSLSGRDGRYRHRFSVMEEELKSDSGIVCLVDQPFVGKRVEREKPGGWIGELLEAWGDPADPSKSDDESFVEGACHLAVDSWTGKPDIGTNGHGAFFGVPRGTELRIKVMFDSEDGSVHGMETML